MSINWKNWANTKYYVDYLAPLGIWYSVAPFDPRCVLCTVHRSRSGPGFSERDAVLLHITLRHLFNMYKHLNRLEDLRERKLSGQQIEGDFAKLTKGEAEIVRLLFIRLTAGEAASVLHISRRTVEKHIADMYEKLGVWDRHSLLQRVYGKDMSSGFIQEGTSLRV